MHAPKKTHPVRISSGGGPRCIRLMGFLFVFTHFRCSKPLIFGGHFFNPPYLVTCEPARMHEVAFILCTANHSPATTAALLRPTSALHSARFELACLLYHYQSTTTTITG